MYDSMSSAWPTGICFDFGVLHRSRGDSKLPTPRLKRTVSYVLEEREQERLPGRNKKSKGVTMLRATRFTRIYKKMPSVKKCGC
jgi:hypothetical protein